MSQEDRYEYRIRAIIASQVGHDHIFGRRGANDAPTNIELQLGEMSDQGWELMPITMQFVEGYVALIFRRPRR